MRRPRLGIGGQSFSFLLGSSQTVLRHRRLASAMRNPALFDAIGRSSRLGGTLVLTSLALALSGCGGESKAAVDPGTDVPPAALTEDEKALWMTEWVACSRVTLASLSSALRVPVRDETPEVAARKLSQRAMRDLYPTQAEREIGADGCRNGVLWRLSNPEPAA